MDSFLVCDAFTRQYEGGYQCVHEDPGNWTGGNVGVGSLIGTNGGISAPRLMQFLGREPTVTDMQTLSVEGQQAIRRDDYWVPLRGDALPSGLNLLMYDDAIMSGFGSKTIPGAVTRIQTIAGVTVDGQVGPATLTAISMYSVDLLLFELLAAQALSFTKDGAFSWAAHGWGARLSARFALALQLAH